MKKKEKYKQIYEYYLDSKKSSHTWMNYYSLFNGALLVAYCTILVSTGYIVELNAETSSGVGEKSFWLNCTYWHLLLLIAILGIIASYCWLLSMVGHYFWTNNWRAILQKRPNKFNTILTYRTTRTNKLSFGEQTMQHYYSTYRITLVFISSVIYAWIFVAFYSYSQYYNHSIWLFSLLILIVLLLFEFGLHLFLGSDVGKLSIKKENTTTNKEEKSPRWHYICLMSIGILTIIWIIHSYCIDKAPVEPTYKLNFQRFHINENGMIEKDTTIITSKQFIRK